MASHLPGPLIRASGALLLVLTAAPALAEEWTSPFGAALDEAGLAAIAGREDTTSAAFSNHVATVTQNQVGDNSQTGEVTISDSAFQNLTGLSAININTGNNVAVTSALNVNISITALP